MVECAAGYYAVGNATACLLCPPGMACADTVSEPVACADGFFSLGGQSDCTFCYDGAWLARSDAACC
jgi:hypothetical protein